MCRVRCFVNVYSSIIVKIICGNYKQQWLAPVRMHELVGWGATRNIDTRSLGRVLVQGVEDVPPEYYPSILGASSTFGTLEY